MVFDPESAYSSQAAAPAGSLFETFADRVLRRVDDVIAGRDCQWPVMPQQRLLLELLRPHQGKGRAVPLTYIAARMALTGRTVKELVRDLRLSFGVQVGSSRDAEAGGYYIIATEKESDESCQLMYAQAISELRVYHSMRRNRESLTEMLRQIELELKEVA